LSEIKPGNTFYDNATGTLNTSGGAIAIAVNEPANTLYVASVNGTVSVFALDPASAPAAFSVNGVIKDAQGVPAAGVTVNAAGSGASASAVTDATGLFVLTGLPAGAYTIKPASTAFSFAPASQSVAVNSVNVRGLAFTTSLPVVPSSFTLPSTMIGPGVAITASVGLDRPAPAGGAVLALSASDPKAAKFPSTVTVPAGQSSVSFQVQGNGVSAPTIVALMATRDGATASTTLTVAPSDKPSISAATYSQSKQVLTVTATDTNPAATVAVQNANNNAILGPMTNLGDGSYSFQLSIATSVPTSVNIISNLGGKTGQGVKLIQ
jgi:hypothetical protein